MLANSPLVHVVDDDVDFGNVIRMILGHEGLQTENHRSAESFLAAYRDLPECPRCMLLDVHLNGMSGLTLLERMTARRIQIPVIFVTGSGDVSTAVSAMKAGATDYLEKPINATALVNRVRRALDCDARHRLDRMNHMELEHSLESLSAREKEVLDLLLDGANAKQVAGRLGIAVKTAMKHRAHVLEKLNVESTVQLMRRLAPRTEQELRPGESDVDRAT